MCIIVVKVDIHVFVLLYVCRPSQAFILLHLSIRLYVIYALSDVGWYTYNYRA